MAWPRIVTLAALPIILWAISCRPAWAPDGKRLWFPARQGDRVAIAEHDLESGTTRIVHPVSPADGAGVVVWDPEGSRFVLIEADGVEDSNLIVATLDKDGNQSQRHTVNIGVRNVAALAAEPIVLDGGVFVTGKRPLRIDLATGDVTKGEGPRAGFQVPTLFRYGNEIGYAATGRKAGRWEIGKLDPETLAATPTFTSPADSAWAIVPHPSISAELDRIAVVAFQGTLHTKTGEREWAILVLAENAIETVIPLGKGLVAGPLRWSPDRVTIVATIVRVGDDQDTFALLETDFSGTVRREYELVQNPVNEQLRGRSGGAARRMLPFAMQPAISPDGRYVAYTTALLPELAAAQHGLLLLDTKAKGAEREIRRLPFPEPR